MKKRNDQFEKRLKNFLSDEQIAKYKELRNRNQRPQGNRDQAPPSQQRQNNREERNR
jgi:hypothetical protein